MPPHGGDAPFHGVVRPGLGHDRRAFGQTVADGDLAHPEPVHDPAHERLGADRTGHDARPQSGEVETRKDAVIQHGLKHGRHAVERGATFLIHGAHDLHGRKGFQQDHGRPVVDAGHDPEHAAEAVEKRDGQADTVQLGKFLMKADPVAVVDDIDVGEHHALGKARGPGRILHVHHVIGRNGSLAPLISLVAHVSGQAEDLGQGIHAPVFFGPQKEDPLEVGQGFHLQHTAFLAAQLGDDLIGGGDEVVIPHPFNNEEIFGFGLLEQIEEFRIAVVGVYGDEHRADARGSKHERQPMRDVGSPDGDLFSLLYAESHEPPSHRIHTVGEFRPRLTQVAIRMDNGVVVGKTGGGIFQKLAQRQLLHGKLFHRKLPQAAYGLNGARITNEATASQAEQRIRRG